MAGQCSGGKSATLPRSASVVCNETVREYTPQFEREPGVWAKWERSAAGCGNALAKY